MGERDEAPEGEASELPGPENRAGVDIALGRTSRGNKAIDAEAAAFLREQRALIADQRHHLKVQLKHLGLKYFADRLRVGLQIFVALGASAVALFVVGMVWQAATDRGLVVEAFSVPPDMAAQGITGEVVASQLEDKLSGLQAATDSTRAEASYSNDWGHEIKVEIPETGVSISELQRYLRQWLGHETHVSGEIFHTPDGLKLTVRTGGSAGDTASGPPTDLDGLLVRAAEALFARTQPYRYGVYLRENNRGAEAKTVFANLAANGPPSERPWAVLGIAQFLEGVPAELAMERQAAALNPNLALVWLNLSDLDQSAGHAEAALAEARTTIRLIGRPDRGSITERSADTSKAGLVATLDDLLGDYRDEVSEQVRLQVLPEFYGSHEQARVQQAATLALDHDTQAAAAMWPGMSDAEISRTIAKWQSASAVKLYSAEVLEDWPAALAEAQGLDTVVRGYAALPDGGAALDVLRTTLWPHEARILAHLGRGPEAWAMIIQTPSDCYDCVRARGEIAALAGRRAEVDRWFAEAVRQGPSLPHAHLDWARARLARGDVDGAIAELTLAHAKGPHFADPLEQWGEALMRKGDFGGAAGKFTAADREAPRWGRNHLLWGEALARLGKADQAKAQWRAAAGMDLSAADRAELARVQPGPP